MMTRDVSALAEGLPAGEVGALFDELAEGDAMFDALFGGEVPASSAGATAGEQLPDARSSASEGSRPPSAQQASPPIASTSSGFSPPDRGDDARSSKRA